MNDNYSAASGQGIYAGRFAPAAAQLDLVVAGDSLTADSYPSAGFRWGAPLSRTPLKLVYNAGVANDTLDNLWTRWQTTVLDKLPSGGVIFLRIGTNSVGAADFNTKYQRFIDTVLARNDLKMVMFALPPKSNNGSVINGHNSFISSAVAQDPSKLFYIQDSLALGDTSYNYLQAYYIDQIHMNSLGQYTQGLVQKDAVKAIFGESNAQLVMLNESYLTNPLSNQWVKNPLNDNSGQYWSSGATGAGTAVSAATVPADGADENQTPWQGMTITSTGGSNHTASVVTTLSHPAVSGQISKARLTAEVWFDDLNGGVLGSLRVYSQSGSNVFISGWKMGLSGCGILQHKVIIDQEFDINTALTYAENSIPLRFEIGVSAAGANAGRLLVRNVSVRVQ